MVTKKMRLTLTSQSQNKNHGVFCKAFRGYLFSLGYLIKYEQFNLKPSNY